MNTLLNKLRIKLTEIARDPKNQEKIRQYAGKAVEVVQESFKLGIGSVFWRISHWRFLQRQL